MTARPGSHQLVPFIATQSAAAGLIVSRLRAPSNGLDIAMTSVHLAVGERAMGIAMYDHLHGVYEDGVYFRHHAPLVTDGRTEYSVTLRRSGDTITVVNVDGSTMTFPVPVPVPVPGEFCAASSTGAAAIDAKMEATPKNFFKVISHPPNTR